MSNPYAIKLANTNLGRALRVLVRGENFAEAYEGENAHIRDYPESAVPRLLQEAFEDVYARLAKLEKENKALRKDLRSAVVSLEKHDEALQDAIDECERGHTS